MFEDTVPSAQRMKKHLVYALWSWARFVTDFNSQDNTDFLRSLGYVLVVL